jgi:ABC-type nitrate/sulfonate/bicarbonate transport system substrate-binding protein
MKKIRIGQFSQSPVLFAIAYNNFLSDYQIEVTNVTSSPAQFESLMKGDLDIALTSPDNVLLYGTTEKNPLGEMCDLIMLRSIDRGLDLSLVSTPEITTPEDLLGAVFCIDSPTSGFALLLNSMLKRLEIDISKVTFVPAGSTPKRLVHMIEGSSQASILNAESKVRAEEKGFRTWMNVADISNNYLGTVICVQRLHENREGMHDFMSAWKRASDWLLNASISEYFGIFGEGESVLKSEKYYNLLHDSVHGLTRDNALSLDALQTLVGIREESNAYCPRTEDLSRLISNKYG